MRFSERRHVPAERLRANRLLRRTARHGDAAVIALAVTSILLAVGGTLLPAVLGKAIDSVVIGEAPRSWLVWLGVLVALLIVCDALDDLATGAVAARSTAWLRHTLLGHILALGTRVGARFSTGEIATRMVGNSTATGRVAVDVIRGVADVIPAIGGTVALALIDIWLCLVFLAGTPVLLLLLRAFSRDISASSEAYLATQGRIAARLGDALVGGRTIAAAGTMSRETSRVLVPLPELHRHGIDLWRAQRRISAQDALVLPLLQVAVLAVAGAQLAKGRITPGEMLAASQYVLLAANLGTVAGLVADLARARAASGRVAEILDEPRPRYGSEPLPDGPGKLELREVTVRHDGRPVLEDVSLVIPGGSLVALVGRSGAGKTLIAGLLGRLVDPDEGEVLLDGVSLTQLSRRELRDAVGYGFERPALLGESIGDAIAFGPDRPSREQVVAAATAARADDFISRMPAGYDTALAEAPMSGGEMQRVGLARTFAHAGRVVVLDDVAASLDTVTEHHIGLVITGALADRTRIIVAHRASTAARADKVVWLDDGGVRAMAPHDELWREPEYRRLFEPDGVDGRGGGW